MNIFGIILTVKSLLDSISHISYNISHSSGFIHKPEKPLQDVELKEKEYEEKENLKDSIDKIS